MQVGERIVVTGRREQLDMAGAAGTGQDGDGDADGGDDGDGDADGEHFWCIHPATVIVGATGASTAINADAVPVPRTPPAPKLAPLPTAVAAAGAARDPAATIPTSVPTPATPASPALPGSGLGPGRKSGSRVSGAARRNSNKSHKFARFLVDTFGRSGLRSGAGVVDVAGGNGDLALCLATLHRVQCTVIDPDLRPPSKQAAWGAQLRAGWIAVVRSAPRQTPMLRQMVATWTVPAPHHIKGRFIGAEDPEYVQGVYVVSPQATPRERCAREGKRGHPSTDCLAAERHMQMHAGAMTEGTTGMLTGSATDHDGTPNAAVAALLRDCSVIVGLHPDGPTAAIVDCAVEHGKPWAVVPCCVFRSRYPNRCTCGRHAPPRRCQACLPAAADTAAAAAAAAGPCSGGVLGCSPVVSHADLCLHLANRGGGEAAELDFGGRHMVIWGGGCQQGGGNSGGRGS